MVPEGRESQTWGGIPRLEKTETLGAVPLASPPARRAGAPCHWDRGDACVLRGWGLSGTGELNGRERATSENKVLGGHQIGLGTWWKQEIT